MLTLRLPWRVRPTRPGETRRPPGAPGYCDGRRTSLKAGASDFAERFRKHRPLSKIYHAPAAAIQSIPGRLDEYKWWLVGGFCVLFIFAAVLLWKKPISVTVAPDLLSQQSAEKPHAARANVAKSTEASPSSNGNSLASLDHATASSLDALKDQLFRLELRRQAGTISDDEYSRERAKAEQVLRDLVRG